MGVGTVFSFKQMIDFVWSFIHNWLLNLLIWDETMIRLVDRGVLALMALEIDDRRVVPFAREFAWFAFTVRRYSHWVAIRETSFFHGCFPSGLSTAWQQLPACPHLLR